VVTVTGDSGVQQRYAGTIFSGNYSGTSSDNAMVVGNTISGTGASSGTMSATSTPVYRYSRAVAFQARRSDPKSGRNLWIGGKTFAGGALFMGDAASARNAATILDDLQVKGPIGASGGGLTADGCKARRQFETARGPSMASARRCSAVRRLAIRLWSTCSGRP